MQKKVVVVLGMHRSGTSLIAKSMEVVGCSLGTSLMPERDDNPEGFWEDRDVVDFNDRLLESCHSAWDKPLVVYKTCDIDKSYYQRAKELVDKKIENTNLLAIKDPRICLLLPFWQSVFHELSINVRYLLAYRNPLDVAASLFARNHFTAEKSSRLWLIYNMHFLTNIREKILVVGYTEFLENPVKSLDAISLFLDSPVNEGLQQAFIEKHLKRSLCHSSNTLEALTLDLGRDSGVVRLAGALSNAVNKMISAIDLLAECENSLELYYNKTSELWSAELISEIEAYFMITQELRQQKESINLTIQKMDGEIEERNEFIALQTGEIDELRTVHANDAEKFSALSHRKDELDDHVRQLQEKLEEIWESLDARSRKISRLENDIENQQQQITDYDKLLRDTHTSFSFRLGRILTYPVRKPLATLIIPLLEKNTKLANIFRLVRMFLSSPVKFYSLLSMQRVKNLFRLLLLRPELFGQVVGGYEEIFKADERDKLKLTRKPKDIDISAAHVVFEKVKEPLVSIIIPVYNQVEYTLQCLQSVQKHRPKSSFEIIVADDCSSDRTEELLSAIQGIYYKRNTENLGFLRTCNKAAGFANGQYIFLLNNDTTVTDGWLDSLIYVFNTYADAGIVGSRLVFPDGVLQEAGGIVWNDASGWNYGRNDDPEKPEYNYVKEVDYVSGAAIMFSRKWFVDQGGFDERYAPAYYEDTDLCFEARRQGKKVYLQPRSNIVHFEGVSNGKDLTQGVKKHQMANQQRFLEKWFDTLQKENFPNAENVFQARDRSSKRTTVMVVDHYVPHYDKDAGSRSTFLYLKLMAEHGFNVKFIGDNFHAHQPYTRALQQMGIEVLSGNYYAKNWKTWLNDNAKYIDVAYLHRPHIACKYIDVINCLPKKIKTIYFGHDLHYLRLERQYEVEGDKKLLKKAEHWKEKEWALFKKFDLVYYPSQIEIDIIKQLDKSVNAKAIPLYAFDGGRTETYSARGRTGMLFVGGFNHPPNLDAMLWFCNEILPEVLKKVPDIQLHIVGSNVPGEILKLERENIKVYGFISDQELHALYDRSVMSVVPLRYGAGVKGKVLEAMDRGVPVVTTSIGAEGIDDTECSLAVGDTVESMVEKIVSLCEDVELCIKLVAAGHKVIEEKFSKNVVLKILKEDFVAAKKSVHANKPSIVVKETKSELVVNVGETKKFETKNTNGRQLQRVLIAHGHIFKNAGSSFDWALRKNFGEHFCDHKDDVDMRRGRAEYLSAYLTEHDQLRAISSHHLCMPLPNMANTKILPAFIMRHPIERVRSVYLFERKQAEKTPGSIHAKKYDLRQYVDWRMQSKVSPTIRDYQVRYCAGFSENGPSITLDEALRTAMAMLESTPLVGIVDRYDESMVVFEEALKQYFPDIDLSYVKQNINQSHTHESVADKGKKIIQELNGSAKQLLDSNKRDMKLYDYAVSILDTRIKAIAGFDNKLALFKQRCGRLNRVRLWNITN